ncbi:MAG: hypothetical protein IAE78_27765 [Myxococcus sp.]|nr:hypothetical protein [Myxococcus sp.]
MSTSLVTRFAQAGLPLQVLERPLFGGRGQGQDIVQLDITRRPRGAREESFRLWPGAADNRVLVTTLDKARQQLIVMVHEPRRRFEFELTRHAPTPRDARLVRETRWARVFEQFTNDRKRHFLAGMDEQHLFIAQLPHAAPTVWAAHVALKGDDVRQAERRVAGKTVRQGEWFFLHPTPEELLEVEALAERSSHLIKRHVGIAQAAQLRRVGRPHEADEVLVIKERIYVRGHVKHPDHATLFLRGWRRTFGNTEASQPEGVYWVD